MWEVWNKFGSVWIIFFYGAITNKFPLFLRNVLYGDNIQLSWIISTSPRPFGVASQIHFLKRKYTSSFKMFLFFDWRMYSCYLNNSSLHFPTFVDKRLIWIITIILSVNPLKYKDCVSIHFLKRKYNSLSQSFEIQGLRLDTFSETKI